MIINTVIPRLSELDKLMLSVSIRREEEDFWSALDNDAIEEELDLDLFIVHLGGQEYFYGKQTKSKRD